MWRSSSKQQLRGINRQVQFFYLGGVIREDADLRLMRPCYKRFSPEIYGVTSARLSLATEGPTADDGRGY